MAEYFLVQNGTFFEEEARPALARSWIKRSFHPCLALGRKLLPAAISYREQYHTTAVEPLLGQLGSGLPFDRSLWRALVSEILLYGASEIPELQLSLDTLCCLLAPEHYRNVITARNQLAPIQQVHRGARDLTFGPAVYRPARAGYNNREDVRRLTEYLETLDPTQWSAADLVSHGDLEDDADREDELAFTREWLPSLIEIYRRASSQGQVIVIEQIY